MHLSQRTAWNLEESEFAAALRAARAERHLLDLTVSNPTSCGLVPDAERLLAPLAAPGAIRYRPEPFGMAEARSAVSRYYRDHGVDVPSETVCLTTSTSEAYGFLFQLLCDPGDEVLIARPSYPLFEFIARLHDVRLREYPLHYDVGLDVGRDVARGDAVRSEAGGWTIDFEALRSLVGPRTRALIVVHPSNPTGHLVSGFEREMLEQMCAALGLALIVDEVFLDYTLPGATSAQTFAGTGGEAVCFTLSGLSKVCGLPQMKLSWVAVRAPKPLLTQILERLEVIADTYLSLNAPVQYALPLWLGARRELQEQIRERLATNLEQLDRRLQGTYAERLAFEAGWTTVLRVPRHVGGQEFASACLDRAVVVQPGPLYGLPEGRAVLSLLTPPEVWTRGLDALPIDEL